MRSVTIGAIRRQHRQAVSLEISARQVVLNRLEIDRISGAGPGVEIGNATKLQAFPLRPGLV